MDKKDEDIYKILSLNLLKIIALGNDNSLKGIKNITIENAIENLISKSEKYKEIYKLLGGKTMKNTIQTFKNAKYEGKKLIYAYCL